jgi:hypothetical protein
MRKLHINDEFLVLLGSIISRLFTCSNVEKNQIKKTKGACSSPISMLEINKTDRNATDYVT